MSRLLLALALRAAQVEAADGFELAWDAPERCPDQLAVEQRIHALLSASSVAGRGQGVRAWGHVELHDAGFRLELRLEADHRNGVRRIESRSCQELAHAAALIVSIAIDPSLAANAPDAIEAPHPEPHPEPEPVVEPPIPTPGHDDERAPQSRQSRGAADAVDPRRRRIGFGLHAGAGIDALLWRPVGASLVLGAALIGRIHRIELAARYATPSTVVPRPSLDTRVQQWSLGMSACAGPRLGARRRAHLSMCG
ncbi:MAG: hypothetical protein IAG13_30985, partial [Deltaproteobacteria bacterium]|nr:hypothetical protein [Nannocystaceae bacterium]